MHADFLTSLTVVIASGIAAQWLAWALGMPSILFLLCTGVIVGPVLGVVNPTDLFGNMFHPFVSLSVAILLFEGGLGLKFSEIPGVRGVIFSLISVGVLVTWVIASLGASYFLGLNLEVAVVLGAILTVSGPTVIIPMLRDVRLRAPVGKIIRWEGVLIDPSGAVFAVLVYEAIALGGTSSMTGHVAIGVLETLVAGGLFGAVGAYSLIFILRRYLVPDFLQSAITLAIVVGVYTALNSLFRESGLLAVTLMGVIIANSSNVMLKHIREFKENLQVVLVSMVFILLGANLKFEVFELINLNTLGFLLLLVFVARPCTVLLSTLNSKLGWSERLYLSAIAPRGIVAAAVASLLAGGMVELNIEKAELIAPYTFLVIVGTVVLVSLTARPLAGWLGLRQKDPQGVLFFGAHPLARKLALVVQGAGLNVLCVDTNPRNVAYARRDKIPVVRADIFSEETLDDLELDGIGRLFALTSNEDANSLATIRLSEFFSRSEVYQLARGAQTNEKASSEEGRDFRGRVLFREDLSFTEIENKMKEGAEISEIEIAEEDTLESLKAKLAKDIVPLFLIAGEKKLEIFTVDKLPKLKAGAKLVYLG